MIIKSTENILSYAFGVKPASDSGNSAPGDSGRAPVIFDAQAASIVLSVFNQEEFAVDALDGFSKGAQVKFMITMQDENRLRALGYSQPQIDKLKPQEAMDIIQAGTKAEPARDDNAK